MRWVVIDSLYNPDAFFASHLDSYSHYLEEHDDVRSVQRICLNQPQPPMFDDGSYLWRGPERLHDQFSFYDYALILDRYDIATQVKATKKIAQVAAVCSPMPFEVRNADGSPAYSLILSSIPAMVDRARAAGCNATYMPLAFDLRARVCGMGVKRENKCIFIGSTGPNHRRRTELLHELRDVVEVLPPVFGREYFKALAGATVCLNPHAEWSGGDANNMRAYESRGMNCAVVEDGQWLGSEAMASTRYFPERGWRRAVEDALRLGVRGLHWSPEEHVLAHETYESRIPRLIDLAAASMDELVRAEEMRRVR